MNLSISLRRKPVYFVFGGIYKGNENINQWLQPLLEQFQLLDQGIPTLNGASNQIFQLRARSLPGIYDLVGYSEVFLQVSPAGQMGCMYTRTFLTLA